MQDLKYLAFQSVVSNLVFTRILTGPWTNLYYNYLAGIRNTVSHILPQMDETEEKANSSCTLLLLLKLLGKALIYKRNAPQITIFAIKSSTSMPHR